MDREQLDEICGWTILALIGLALVFTPLAFGGVRAQDFLISEGLIGLSMVVWAIRLWVQPTARLLWPPLCWGVLGFTAYAIWRYSMTPVEMPARYEMIQVVVYACLFFLVLNNLHKQELGQWICITLVVLGSLLSIYAIYQVTTNSFKVWTLLKPLQYAKRGGGTYINPNHFAGFIEMVLPIGLALVITGRLNHLSKILLGYGCGLMLVGLAISFSRAGWIAASIGLLVLLSALLLQRGNRLPALVAVVILLGGGFVFAKKSNFAAQRVHDATTRDDTNQRLRFAFWKPAVQIWEDQPWFGAGPAQFDYRFPKYRPILAQARPGYTHNDYLNSLADYGLMGVGLIGFTLFSFFVLLRKTWPHIQRSSDFSSARSNKTAIVVGGSAGIIAMLVHSLADFNLHLPANAMVFVTLLAIVSSYVRFATESYWVKPRIIGKIIVALLVIGFSAYAYEQARITGPESFSKQKAETLPPDSPQRLDLLKLAHKIDPKNFVVDYQIGEWYRVQSWQGEPGYEALAQEATNWFGEAIKLNPFAADSYLRRGMCLDWLGKTNAATVDFDRAFAVDPNSAYVLAIEGWHRIQLGDYAGARPWLQKSLDLKSLDNPIASNYIGVVDEHLKELQNSPPPP